MKHITFKAVYKMGSCWVRNHLHIKYRSGRTFLGKHRMLPLFVISPEIVAENHQNFWFAVGAPQDGLIVVMYDDKDVAGFTPLVLEWDVSSTSKSVEILADNAIMCHVNGFGLHKLRVLCKVDAQRFSNAAMAFAFYQKKYLKNNS